LVDAARGPSPPPAACRRRRRRRSPVARRPSTVKGATRESARSSMGRRPAPQGAAGLRLVCGERALLFAYEESSAQIVRNMRSIGIDLEHWLKKGLLQIHASRPTLHGLEQHLVAMHDTVLAFRPSMVAVDPISNLTMELDDVELKPTLMRLIDSLKQEQITAVFTSLTSGGSASISPEDSQVGVSSLMDVWLLLRNHEHNGERNRTLYVLKARGMAHSNQVREFVLSDAGIDLVEVYLGSGGVLTGTSRVAQEAREHAAASLRLEEHQRQLRKFASKRKAIEAQIAMLQAEAELEDAELNFAVARVTLEETASRKNSDEVARMRGGRREPGSKPVKR